MAATPFAAGAPSAARAPGAGAPAAASTGSAVCAASAVLVRNGEAAAPGFSKERLLKEHTGAYTTARTVDQTAVFELSMHIERLRNTAATLLRKQGASGDGTCEIALRFLDAEGRGGLAPLVRGEIRTALEHLGGLASDDRGVDYQVTLLLTCDTVGPHTSPERGFDIFTFAQPLPPVPAMADVEACQAERATPTLKDLRWVTDRQHLEAKQRAAGVNEVLMFGADGSITEGLQTNFFAVVADGALVTAPDERVLAGTVRKVALEVARRQGLPVRLECPNLRELGSWESCFICSTSRLVLPVREFRAPELEAPRRFPAAGSVAHRLAELVAGDVRSRAEPVAEPPLR